MKVPSFLVEWLLGPFSMLRKVWPSILALSVLTLAATLVFHHFHATFTWLDALYASVNTITTIGLYGTTELANMPEAEKAILIVIIIFSVGSAATALQNIVSAMVQRELWLENVMRWRARHMDKHAVVVGAGNCAREIAKKLANLGMPHVVVVPESSQAPVADFAPAPLVKGDLRRHTTLSEAGAVNASQFEIAVDDDALALVVTMNARQLNPKARIIVNADDEELTQHFKTAGANVVICSSRVIGRAMAVAAVTDHVSGMIFSELAGLQKEIGVFTVALNSPAAGRSIGDSEVHLHAWILGVVRAGTFHWEVGRESILHAGDVIVVLGDVKAFESLRRLVVEA